MIEGHLSIRFSAERREIMKLSGLAVSPATEFLMLQSGAASIPANGIRVEDSLGGILGTDEGDDGAAFSGNLPEQLVNRRQRQLPIQILYGL